MTDNKCPLGENSSAFARLESKIDSRPSPLTVWHAISVAAGFLVAFFGIWGVAADKSELEAKLAKAVEPEKTPDR